ATGLRLLLCFLLPFSFPPSPPHRDLPSFPTRRSSDLRVFLSHAPRPSDPPRVRHAAPAPDGRTARWAPTISRSTRDAPHPARTRSEEHTSELQSRENLVCRLLLEKKKKTKKETRAPLN